MKMLPKILAAIIAGAVLVWIARIALVPREQNAGSQQARPPVDFSQTKAAAEQGDARAQNTLGDLYAGGRGAKQDFNEAVKWYKRAADQSYAPGEYNLGMAYSTGLGVALDAGESVKWYRKAADQGNVQAQYNLGLMYSGGLGVPHDPAEAVKWFRLAADQGDALSQYNLGRRYKEGFTLPENPAEAYKWLSLAAANGITDATRERDDLKRTMTKDQLTEAGRLIDAFKTNHKGVASPQ